MKKIILSLGAILFSLSSFAGLLTVYGSQSTTTTTTTTNPDKSTSSTTTVNCSGDMTKVCYTRATESPTPKSGQQIAIAIYENGQPKESHVGILESYTESGQFAVYTLQVQQQ